MRNRLHRPMTALAYALITVAFLTTVAALSPTPAAPADHTTLVAAPADACQRVTRADRALCRTVQAQHPYGRVNPEGSAWSKPNGRAIVRDLLTQQLSRAGLRAALTAERKAYRDNVTHVRVNMDTLRTRCGSDGQYVVKFLDADRRPGGVKLTQVIVDCP